MRRFLTETSGHYDGTLASWYSAITDPLTGISSIVISVAAVYKRGAANLRKDVIALLRAHLGIGGFGIMEGVDEVLGHWVHYSLTVK